MRLFRKITEAFPEVKHIKHYLPDNEYCKQVVTGGFDRFMNHCTGGSSLKYLGGTGGIWDSDQQGPVATMFGIEKDGTLYQYFDEDYWAYASGCGAAFDRKTIHCEMSNRAFVRKIDGQYYWQAGAKWVPYNDTPIHFAKGFKGYNYFDPYTPQQVETMAKLIAYCCYNHGIPLEFDHEINYKGCDPNQKGILNHSRVSNQRADPGPAFPYKTCEILAREHFLNLCKKHGYPVYGEKPKV